MIYRRNADRGLRALERRWVSGEDAICGELVAARLRAGLPRYGVVASMLLGNECAREALGLPTLPRLTPYWPWGFPGGVSTDHRIGPWPSCCDWVYYQGPSSPPSPEIEEGELVIRSRESNRPAGRRRQVIGHLLDALSHLGPEYWLAFAACAVKFVGFRFGLRASARVPESALAHAEQLAVEGTGDMSPHEVIFFNVERGKALGASEHYGDYQRTPMENAHLAIAELSHASTSEDPEDMIQHSINAMARAANTILTAQEESILYEPLWGESRLRTPEGQWERADELLEHMFLILDGWLSPWLLGFRAGPVDG
ncbi:unnamed protein product [marine sediment metagenome]|uniref:Uncharacterized protein n=1 Tax=marine sediment metagenome TaxID=412755 RepID=X0TP21_9ZZZZ